MIGQYWALNYALQETCSPNHHAAICRASEHERIIVWQIGDWAAERHALTASYFLDHIQEHWRRIVRAPSQMHNDCFRSSAERAPESLVGAGAAGLRRVRAVHRLA